MACIWMYDECKPDGQQSFFLQQHYACLGIFLSLPCFPEKHSEFRSLTNFFVVLCAVVKLANLLYALWIGRSGFILFVSALHYVPQDVPICFEETFLLFVVFLTLSLSLLLYAFFKLFCSINQFTTIKLQTTSIWRQRESQQSN